jgi:hypothetical protein
MYVGLQVKYPKPEIKESTRYSCQILVKFELSGQISEKIISIKFRDNPSSGRRVVPCGQTDMTKLIGAFRNFANTLKN